MLGDRREKSNLHDLFEERFGESLDAPQTYQVYELTEREKRRLEALRALDEERAVAQAAPQVPVQTQAVAAQQQVETSEEGEEKALSFWNFKQLWLYEKYGKGEKKVKKYLVMLFSIIGFIPATIIRILYFIITFPIKLMRKRKAKKAEAAATES
jgi:hypothetical protein